MCRDRRPASRPRNLDCDSDESPVENGASVKTTPAEGSATTGPRCVRLRRLLAGGAAEQRWGGLDTDLLLPGSAQHVGTKVNPQFLRTSWIQTTAKHPQSLVEEA